MINFKFIPKTFLFSCLAASLFFISCEDKEKVEVNSTEVSQEAPVEQDLKTKNFVVPAEGSASSNSSNVAVNPPHGQPGHDCAIPVGAPLNGSAPAAPQAPAQPQLQAPNLTPMDANNAPATGEGMNPPHGQPGHRCDIPVGAPL